jgi:hypothetical protein
MCRRCAPAGVACAQRLPESRREIDHRDPWEFCGKPVENAVEPPAAADKPRDMREAFPMNR